MTIQNIRVFIWLYLKDIIMNLETSFLSIKITNTHNNLQTLPLVFSCNKITLLLHDTLRNKNLTMNA